MLLLTRYKRVHRRRTRKKRHPTRDWKPAMLSPVCQYRPPQNTPRNAEITMCARKNVLSLNKNKKKPISTPHPFLLARFTNRRRTFHSRPASTCSCVKNAAALLGCESRQSELPHSLGFTAVVSVTVPASLVRFGLSRCSAGVCARSRRWSATLYPGVQGEPRSAKYSAGARPPGPSYNARPPASRTMRSNVWYICELGWWMVAITAVGLSASCATACRTAVTLAAETESRPGGE